MHQGVDYSCLAYLVRMQCRVLRYPPFAEIEKKLNSKMEEVRPGAVRAAAHEVRVRAREGQGSMESDDRLCVAPLQREGMRRRG